MSFSAPRNVPNFNSQQRSVENGYWGSSGLSRTQNGHSGARIGGKLENYFDKRQLPMYKDKPYNYAASGRQRPWYQRRRILAGLLCGIFGLAYWLGLFPGGARVDHVEIDKSWPWLRKSTSSNMNWNDRRERVKEAFTLSWDGYEKYAWGNDEYHPVSKEGRQMSPKGMGWIIVDALDTLMIMNLTSRLSHAREWISTSLDYDQDYNVNTFETTIRMLGGLLSAHYLSTEFPNMAPIPEDDHGAPGEDLYLEEASDLADRILGAFESGSGIPFASVNLKDFKGVPSHADGGASSTAEVGSLQLEFKYLAMLTGEKNYWEKVEKVIQVIDDNGMEAGLLPIFIYPNDGEFRGNNIRLGSRGDSYYEYLIKQYLQTSGQEPIYLELWDQALAGVRKHLITYSTPSHFTVIGERPNGIHEALSPKMDHLVCFMPGTIALSATKGLTIEEARKQGKWGKKEDEEMNLAAELTKTCWGMYKVMATGLAPEISSFHIDDPPHMESDGILSSVDITNSSETAWKDDYQRKRQDLHNLQRPETVETLFYMWRITGDEMYREWGWEMFKSFMNYTKAADGAGFTSLSNADEIPPTLKDNMESFWLAETLKYFYLLFSPVDLLPLDSIVINTEAHIFPRFKLTRGLKTGWKRKPRDSDGSIIKKDLKGKVSEKQRKKEIKDGKKDVKKGGDAKEEKDSKDAKEPGRDKKDTKQASENLNPHGKDKVKQVVVVADADKETEMEKEKDEKDTTTKEPRKSNAKADDDDKAVQKKQEEDDDDDDDDDVKPPKKADKPKR